MEGLTATTRVTALAVAEVRILLRNKLVCATALLLPLGLGALIASDGEDGTWGDVVAMQFVMVLAAIASAAWVLATAPDAVTWVMHLTPGGALADLVRQGWERGGQLLPPIAGLLVWTGIGWEITKRWLSWEPRR